ncbi:disease resistance protein RUN1-like isoform X2 [Lotus japonicus]|uniref:disease resistance protein RUN1-like isoform X2 n=1 Tax=Lotus japonicus TaxID=34305 RepID=UPI00258E4553|nr:disease resistance protein RUN1-like isoform X2 [Lotus japonicus]
MEIQSSSSTPMIWKYDVFVSFRGEDTRNNFTDHLFGALYGKGFVTFKDDTMLRKGKNISTELIQAIEGSQILIVVFSKYYASSTWCLQELAKIADCIEGKRQTVLPVFCDVTPSEVRKQSGNYGEAFLKHEERFKEDLQMVQRWRKALAQVADLSGWDVTNKPQDAQIGEVIKQVTDTLSHKFSTIPDDVVGIQSPLKELEKLLVLDSNGDVRVLGICGMGGLGKSTLATFLYQRISNQFDATCFIDDISKLLREQSAMEAQKQILSQTLNEENLQLYNLPMTTNLMQTRLCHKKALIVLYNVDEVKQLYKLALKRGSLGAGSRIIIISRDEHILREYPVDEVYKVQLLKSQDALQLFCRKAFKCDDVMSDEYIDLANEVLEYAGRLPLAINVLGSFLFGRNVDEWRSALARLREYPEKDVMDVLRISFDALKDTEKEIFLDISCFFNKKSREYVKEVLDFRGFFPEIGIKVLIDKSLLVVDDHEIFKMHDLLKELGKNIVREKFPEEPWKWSRLWDYKNFHKVMLENKTTETLQAIVIEQSWKHKFLDTTMKADTLSKMSHLKLLIFKDENVNFLGSLNHLSNELGYLHLKNYPFKCLPPSFQPDKLVELIMPRSSIKQLWEGTKPLHSLKRMNLSDSRSLIKLPDFTEAPNLESLNLEGCIKLVRINESIGTLRKLVGLNLKDCINLVSIPSSIFHLSSLEGLYLSGCSKLLRNNLLEKQRDAEHLEEKVEINEGSIQRKPSSSFYRFLKFPIHSRRHEDSVRSLLPYLPRFPCLKWLDLSFCNLVQIPDAIGLLHSLEVLILDGNHFVTLPCSIKQLSKLRWLNLEHCKELRYLPELPSRSQSERQVDWARLYIFNCPKLCLTKSFYRIVFSWMIQSAKGEIVIPGGEIPRWFSEQNERSDHS